MFKYIALTIFICISLPAKALDPYEWTLDVNTSSMHKKSTYGKNKYYNESNGGFGITYGYSDLIDFKFGYFENSYYKTSVYLGFVLNKDFYIQDEFVISPGIGTMFSTGYDNTPIDSSIITPILYPTLSFGFKTMRSTVGLIPSDSPVLTFQVQVQF